jgi:hypothetical protein
MVPERKEWLQMSATPFRSIPYRKPGMNFRSFKRRSLGEESKAGAKDLRWAGNSFSEERIE